MKKIFLIIMGIFLFFSTLYLILNISQTFNETIGLNYRKSLQKIEREVFKTSKSHVENSVKTLASYKMQYDLAGEDDKKIIANNIKIEFANFDEKLIENYQLRSFFNEINGAY